MRAFHSDAYVLPLPPGHTFPMPKYRLLREAVAQRLPGVRIETAPAASEGELALAHEPAWIDAVFQGTLSAAAQREIGFPWSAAMVERSRRSVGATIAAARAALLDGEGVKIGQEIQAVVLVLEFCPIIDRTNVISQSQITGDCTAAKNGLFHREKYNQLRELLPSPKAICATQQNIVFSLSLGVRKKRDVTATRDMV